jgi:hypothetical protein
VYRARVGDAMMIIYSVHTVTLVGLCVDVVGAIYVHRCASIW